MAAQQQGRQANLTGNQLEQFIEGILVNHGYDKVNKAREFDATVASSPRNPHYAKQYVVKNCIYGRDLRCDFVLYHPALHLGKLLIESKWQQNSGSVDEKFPYLVENINYCYPYPTIVVIDGGGYKKGAEQWLRAQVRNNLLNVFSMQELMVWANNGGL